MVGLADFLSPEDRQFALAQGLLGFGANILGQGPSPTPIGLGQSLGTGLAGFNQGVGQGLNSAVTLRQTGLQFAEADEQRKQRERWAAFVASLGGQGAGAAQLAGAGGQAPGLGGVGLDPGQAAFLAAAPPNVGQQAVGNMLFAEPGKAEPFTLSPGQTRFDPTTGQPIASLPDRPEKPDKATPYSDAAKIEADRKAGFITNAQAEQALAALGQGGKNFDRENVLRDEFNALTKDFRVVQDAYTKIKATSDTGAGDMSLLYSYVKLLDPGSVVRESEFATAAASGSFGEQVKGAVQRLLTGERLPATLRQAFKDEAERVYRGQKEGADRLLSHYQGLATAYGLDPEKVAIGYNPPDAPKAGRSPIPETGQAPGQAEAAAPDRATATARISELAQKQTAGQLSAAETDELDRLLSSLGYD